MVIATGFTPLSQLSIVFTMVVWESSQWLRKNLMWRIGQKNARKAKISVD